MLSPQSILSHACAHYAVPFDVLLGRTREPATVRARECVTYLLRKVGFSFPEVAAIMSTRTRWGGTLHSTAITAQRRTLSDPAAIAEFEAVAAGVPRSSHRRVVLEAYIKRHYRRTRDKARRDADLATLAGMRERGTA